MLTPGVIAGGLLLTLRIVDVGIFSDVDNLIMIENKVMNKKQKRREECDVREKFFNFHFIDHSMQISIELKEIFMQNSEFIYYLMI